MKELIEKYNGKVFRVWGTHELVIDLDSPPRQRELIKRREPDLEVAQYMYFIDTFPLGDGDWLVECRSQTEDDEPYPASEFKRLSEMEFMLYDDDNA